MSKLTIITGSSRGLGQAMAAQCLNQGQQVIGIARQASSALASITLGEQLQQWLEDLNEPSAAAHRLQSWIQRLRDDGAGYSEIRLINNAGVIAPLAPLDLIPVGETTQALRVGLEAAMVMTSAFLRATNGWAVPRKVLNISSGLGRRPMAGSASYCAAKAGMDHFSRCVALEEAQKAHGARIVSLAPGVIATDMQVQLRNADPTLFPDRDAFIQLEAQGMLMHREEAAKKVLAYLDRSDFGEQPVADIRG